MLIHHCLKEKRQPFMSFILTPFHPKRPSCGGFMVSAFGLDIEELPRGCQSDIIVIPAAKRVVSSENMAAALLAQKWVDSGRPSKRLV